MEDLGVEKSFVLAPGEGVNTVVSSLDCVTFHGDNVCNSKVMPIPHTLGTFTSRNRPKGPGEPHTRSPNRPKNFLNTPTGGGTPFKTSKCMRRTPMGFSKAKRRLFGDAPLLGKPRKPLKPMLRRLPTLPPLKAIGGEMGEILVLPKCKKNAPPQAAGSHAQACNRVSVASQTLSRTQWQHEIRPLGELRPMVLPPMKTLYTLVAEYHGVWTATR